MLYEVITEENQKHFNGYREYLSTVLADKNDEMCNFNSSCNSFFQNQFRITSYNVCYTKLLREDTHTIINPI